MFINLYYNHAKLFEQYSNAKCSNNIMQNVFFSRYKHEKEVVEKDLSLIKQELEEVKKVNEGGPRSPTR